MKIGKAKAVVAVLAMAGLIFQTACSSSQAEDGRAGGTTQESQAAGKTTPPDTTDTSGTVRDESPQKSTASEKGDLYDPDSAALVPEELKGQKLDIPIPPTTPPTKFVNENGELVGLNIDLGDAIAETLGLQFNYQKIEVPTLVPGMQSGRWKLTMSSLNPNPERLEVMNIIPFMETNVAFVARAGYDKTVEKVEDLCGMNIAAETRSSQWDDLEKLAQPVCQDLGKPIKITQLPSTEAGVLAVKSHHQDLFAMATYYVLYMADQDDGVSVPPLRLGGAVTGPATPAAEIDLANAVAAAINHLIETGEMKKIFDEWDLGELALPQAKVLTDETDPSEY